MPRAVNVVGLEFSGTRERIETAGDFPERRGYARGLAGANPVMGAVLGPAMLGEEGGQIPAMVEVIAWRQSGERSVCRRPGLRGLEFDRGKRIRERRRVVRNKCIGVVGDKAEARDILAGRIGDKTVILKNVVLGRYE